MSGQRFRVVDHDTNRVIDKEQRYKQEKLKELLMSKRFAMLEYMIDGRPDPWDLSQRGGTGTVSLNVQGGWGMDAEVRRMLRNGEITLRRDKIKHNSFDGYPFITATVAVVTDKGRTNYAAWKKRNSKRFAMPI